MVTVLFSSGCTINTIVQDNNTKNGVIVFITGALGASHVKLSQNPAVVSLTKNFSAVFYDNRGTGESEYPLLGEITVDALVDDLKIVVNYTKQVFTGQPIYLFTDTYGAIAALSYLEAYPTAVNRLIIDSPILLLGCPETLAKKMESFKRSANRLLNIPLSKKIAALEDSGEGMAQLLYCDELRDYVMANVPMRQQSEEICMHYAMRAELLSCDLRLILDGLCVETLFLQGKRSKLIPWQILKNSVEVYKNRNICFIEFEKQSELIHMNSSEEFTRICSEFLLG